MIPDEEISIHIYAKKVSHEATNVKAVLDGTVGGLGITILAVMEEDKGFASACLGAVIDYIRHRNIPIEQLYNVVSEIETYKHMDKRKP